MVWWFFWSGWISWSCFLPSTRHPVPTGGLMPMVMQGSLCHKSNIQKKAPQPLLVSWALCVELLSCLQYLMVSDTPSG